MRKLITSILLTLLIVGAAAAVTNPVRSAVKGDFTRLYHAGLNTVYIEDISIPAAPRPIGRGLAVGGAVFDLLVAGNRLFVTSDNGRIYIYHLKVDPIGPNAEIVLPPGSSPRCMAAYGDSLYVTDATGRRVFQYRIPERNTDPFTLENTFEVSSSGLYGIAVKRDAIYVSNRNLGEIIKIDPATGTATTISTNAGGVTFLVLSTDQELLFARVLQGSQDVLVIKTSDDSEVSGMNIDDLGGARAVYPDNPFEGLAYAGYSLYLTKYDALEGVEKLYRFERVRGPRWHDSRGEVLGDPWTPGPTDSIAISRQDATSTLSIWRTYSGDGSYARVATRAIGEGEFDDEVPRVITFIPAPGATNVPIDQRIEITFSEEMNPALRYTFRGPGGTVIDTEGWIATWEAGNTRVVLTPDAPFAYSTMYSFMIESAQDLSENDIRTRMAPERMTFFTTRPAGDEVRITNPEIVRDEDTVGSPVIVSWQTEPTEHADVRIFYLEVEGEEEFHTDPSRGWTEIEDYDRIEEDGERNQYTDPNQVRQGTAKYYKVVPHDHTLVRDDLTSNVVGKFDIALAEGDNLISLPLIPTRDGVIITNINEVIGTQLIGGEQPDAADKVLEYIPEDPPRYEQAWLYNNGESAVWLDDEAESIEDRTPIEIRANKGYWVKIEPGHGPTNITIAGKISDTDQNIAITTSFNLVGSSFPMNVYLTDSNLASRATAGVEPDYASKVHEFREDRSGYNGAWLYSGGDGIPAGWYVVGTEAAEESRMRLSPGKGYWIQEPGPGFEWNYPRPFGAE